MRASEGTGISQKHRRLQASDLQNIVSVVRQGDNQSQLELTRDKQLELQIEQNEPNTADQGLPSGERRLVGERRARSSLSNRNSNSRTTPNERSGPAVGPM